MMWGYGQGMGWMWLWIPLLLIGIALLVVLAVKVAGGGIRSGYGPRALEGMAARRLSEGAGPARSSTNALREKN